MGFGAPKSKFHKYLFRVEIDGITAAGFMSCSALKVELDTVEVREGGRLIPQKSPGLAKYEPITLRRGMTTDIDAYVWMSTAVNGATGQGVADPLFRRGVSILQLSRMGIVQRRWDLTGAWPKSWQAGDWDNSASEALIEEMVIEYDFFTLGE